MDPLPHTFQDPSLLELALTHASFSAPAGASSEQPTKTELEEDLQVEHQADRAAKTDGKSGNNERLEFLGDAALDLIVAEELYVRRPNLPEGALTELKSSVVSRTALAEAARELGLAARARLGPGLANRELPRSVLANLYEAVVGAVYLDAGIDATKIFCLKTLKVQLERTEARERASNPKQELQEHCQAEWNEPPRYELLEERGRAHTKAFLVAARVRGKRFPSAWGRTRKEAERWAAHEVLIRLHSQAVSELRPKSKVRSASR